MDKSKYTVMGVDLNRKEVPMITATIVAFKPPIAILSNGQDCMIKDIKGTPRVGANLNMATLEVVADSVDVDCPGGACPIK